MTFSFQGKRNNPPVSFVSKSYLILLICSLLWTLGAVLYPILKVLETQPDLAVVTRFLYSPLCHQDPSRSFTLFSFPLAVCGRCFSLYAGFTVAVLFFPFLKRYFRSLPVSSRSLLVFLSPLLIDVGFSVAGFWDSTFFTRFFTGSIAGIGLGFFTTPAWISGWTEISNLYFRRKIQTRNPLYG